MLRTSEKPRKIISLFDSIKKKFKKIFYSEKLLKFHGATKQTLKLMKKVFSWILKSFYNFFRFFHFRKYKA